MVQFVACGNLPVEGQINSGGSGIHPPHHGTGSAHDTKSESKTIWTESKLEFLHVLFG